MPLEYLTGTASAALRAGPATSAHFQFLMFPKLFKSSAESLVLAPSLPSNALSPIQTPWRAVKKKSALALGGIGPIGANVPKQSLILVVLTALLASCGPREEATTPLVSLKERAAATQARELATTLEGIKRRIESLIIENKFDEAETLAAQHVVVAKDAIEPLLTQARLQRWKAVLAKLAPADLGGKVEAYTWLVYLDPGDVEYKGALDRATKALNAREADALRALRQRELENRKLDSANRQRDLAKRKREGVSIGMSKEEVIQSSWGRPRNINRTITARGEHEQWVYGGGYLYFEDGVLKTIQN